MKSNIGLVSTWHERGASYVTKNYLEIFKELKMNCFVYARDEEYAIGDNVWDNDKVYWAKRSFLPFPKAIDKRDFQNWIKQNNIEIILFNEQQWIIPVLWARELGVKTVAYVDYYTPESVEDFWIYDGLLCNTKRHYQVFQWHPNVLYLPWGLHLKNIPRLSLENDDSRIKFFHSCGWSPERKGTIRLIECFLKYVELSNAADLIIHSQMDLYKYVKAYFPELYHQLDNKSLKIINQTVTFPGLYHLGDVYVYPSSLDGLGVTLYEAALMGLPIITTDEPPMNEISKVPHTKLVKVATRKYRQDDYFWPLVDVDLESLFLQMKSFIDQSNVISDIKKSVYTYSQKHFNFLSNSNVINSFIQDLKILSPPDQINIKMENKSKKEYNSKIKFVSKINYLLSNKEY